MWSDLFLASGGVINFNDGNVTLTHSTDGMTLNSENTIFTSSTSNKPVVEIKNTNDDTYGSTLQFTKDTNSSAAAGDILGNIIFTGEDAGEVATEYAAIVSKSNAVTSGSESGSLHFKVATTGSGANTEVLSILSLIHI